MKLRNKKRYDNYTIKKVIWICKLDQRGYNHCEPVNAHRFCIDEFVRSHFKYRVRKGILILKNEELKNMKIILPPEITSQNNENYEFDLETILPVDSEVFLQSLDEIRKQK